MRWFKRLQTPIARHSMTLFLSESTTAVLILLTGFIIARRCAVGDFGRFSVALAMASIIASIVDSGMGMLAAKQIARDTAAGQDETRQIFSWRLALIVGVSVAGVLLAATFPSDRRWLALGLLPGVLLLSLSDFFAWMLKGAQRMRSCAVVQVASRSFLLILCTLACWRPAHPLPRLLGAYAVAGALATLVGLSVLARSALPLRLVLPSRKFFRQTLPNVYKLGIILILGVAFTRVDVMLVAHLGGDTQAGLYGAAGRIVDALRLIPTVAYSVFLPIFSAAHNQPAVLRARFLPAFDGLLILALSVSLIGSLFGRTIVVRLLGARYGAATEPFVPLVWSCVLMFTNMLMFALLYARNNHRVPLLAIALALVVELALIAWGLPRYGVVAAGWARLLAEFTSSAVMAWGLVRSRLVTGFALFLRPALIVASCLMVLVFLRHAPPSVRLLGAWIIPAVLLWGSQGRISEELRP